MTESAAAVPDDRYTQVDHVFREKDRYARAKYHLTLRWLSKDLSRGATLYNIGCGEGYFNHLATGAGLDVTACEPDAAPYRIASERAAIDGARVEHCGLLEFAENRKPADIVVMHDVLEHIEDDRSAAEAIARLLKPNGRAILSVPALQSLFGYHDVALGHFRRYSPRTLRGVLEGRFHIRRMRFFGLASIPIVLYYSVWKRQAYPLATASKGLISEAYGLVCDVESWLPLPIGTALIAELTPRTGLR